MKNQPTMGNQMKGSKIIIIIMPKLFSLKYSENCKQFNYGGQHLELKIHKIRRKS